ncbi:MAG: hypothetical protein SO116_06510 [Treponema sp.]|nr:hypothetical protein [Treponema sp.]
MENKNHDLKQSQQIMDSITTDEIDGNSSITEEQKKILSAFYKKHLINYGIFAGIIIVLLAFLITFTLLSRNSWREGLKKQVEKVLSNSTEYTCGSWVKLNSLATSQCSVYELVKDGKTVPSAYGIILRVTTMYGPVPAVFTYEFDENKNNASVNFIDFVETSGPLNEKIKASALKNQIAYWKNKIPYLIECTQDNQAD